MARMAEVLAVAAPEAPVGSQHLKVHTASKMTQEDVKDCIARPRVDFKSILETVSSRALHCHRALKCRTNVHLKRQV